MASAPRREYNISALSSYYDYIAKWLGDTRLFMIMYSLDNHIKRNLRKDQIETRPSASNGLWCCLLLPTILVLYTIQHEVSLLYQILACISLGLLFASTLFIVFMSVSCTVLKSNINAGCAASSLVSTLLMFQLLDQGLIFSLLLSIISVYKFSALMRLCLNTCPKVFTIGEALIVVQGLVLLGLAIFLRLFYRIEDTVDPDLNFIIDVNIAIFISTGIILMSLCVLRGEQKDIQTFSYITCVGVVFGLIVLHIIGGYDCLMHIIVFTFFDIRRIQLILFWMILTAMAGLTLYCRTRINVKATTVTRKVFHILASLVFLSGIVYDVSLMTFAAGFGFAALVLVEAIRKSDVKEISPSLEAAFLVYSDEKDVGNFAMTAMYLYVGLACPLILVPIHKNYHLELLSGVLSVGVGDTAASWFGAKYGFNKWADGHKSIEGTAFNVLCQIAVVYGLQFVGLLTSEYAMMRTVFAAGVSGLVEAKTCQIDNLIVPLATIIAFQITYFFTWLV